MQKIVPDEIEEISQSLIEFCNTCDVVFTTGGTGFSKRDVTPEATKLVIEKEATGFVHKMMKDGLNNTDLACLSRMTAGIRGNSLIINFPGSLGGVTDCFASISHLLPHAIDVLHQ